MSGLYEGCWHKLDRAQTHVQALKRDIGIRLHHSDREPLYGFRQEFDPDSDCLSTFIDTVNRPTIEWSLIIGDALTNFRAALDYLAHDLVGRGSRPELKATRTPQFVICRKSVDIDRQIKGRLPGIKSSHRAVIEDFQPYQWVEWKDAHPLALLDSLVRWDKHREIEPVFSQHAHYLYVTITGARDF